MLLDRCFLYVSKNPPTRPTKYKIQGRGKFPRRRFGSVEAWQLAVGGVRFALQGFRGGFCPVPYTMRTRREGGLGVRAHGSLEAWRGGRGGGRPVPYPIRTGREAVGAGAGSGGGAVQSANQPIQLISRRSVGAPTALRSHFPRARLGLCSMSSIYYKVQGAGRGRGRGECDGAWWIFMRDRRC